MKTYKIFINVVIGILLFSSCDLNHIDNYAGPNATIYGGIYDIETGELVEQDIIRGMQIEYIEQGFDNPEIQYMVVKNDGTYRNNLMFAGDYLITPVRGNFVPVEAKEVTVKGNAKVDFKVQPYIRIKDLSIEQDNERIIATFHLEQTVPNNVIRAGLFVYPEKNVGDPLHTITSQVAINDTVDPTRLYRLEINLELYKDKLIKDNKYYFRVGALIDAPEAKYNYAPAIRLTIQDYVPPVPGSNPFILKNPIYIDFGTNISEYPYNNYQRPSDEMVANLIDKEGENSQFTIKVTQNFNGENTSGVVNNSLGFPSSATSDAFWSSGNDHPTSQLTIANLNSKESYTFVLYGARGGVGDNRETKYHIQGINEGADSINVSSNSSDLAVIENINPKKDGTIVLTISPGTNNNNGAKYYYINELIIVPDGYDLSKL